MDIYQTVGCSEMYAEGYIRELWDWVLSFPLYCLSDSDIPFRISVGNNFVRSGIRNVRRK